MAGITEPQLAAVKRVRLIWALLLGGQVLLLIGCGWLRVQPQHIQNAVAYPVPVSAAAVAMASAIVGGTFGRNEIYKAAWREAAVTPAGYMRGMLILLMPLATATFIAAYALILTDAPAVAAGLAAAGLFEQAVNFPTGRPMQPTGPRIEPDHV